MGDAERAVDEPEIRPGLRRLLPRHAVPARAVIDWNYLPRRIGRRRERLEPTAQGILVDVSLEGALIEVPSHQVHRVGDRVVVKFAGVRGVVEIRHSRPSDDGYVLYGVRAFGGTDLARTLTRAVDQIRGDRAALREAWDHAR